LLVMSAVGYKELIKPFSSIARFRSGTWIRNLVEE
jgi:hypothetical protein